jgi:hypothetical protein
MHRLRAGLFAGSDDGGDVQIAFRRRGRADMHRLIRRQNGGGETIRVRIDRDRGDVLRFQRAADARQDFAAVSDEDFGEHLRSAF